MPSHVLQELLSFALASLARSVSPLSFSVHFQNVRTLLLDVRTDLRELQFWRAAVTDKYEKNYDTGEIDLHSLD